METPMRVTGPIVLAAWLALALALPVAQAADNDEATTGKEPTQDLLSDLKAFSAEKKREAQATADELLLRLDERIATMSDQLAEQWDQLSQETRDERQAALQALRDERRALSRTMSDLSRNSGDAWSELKQGFVGAYQALTNEQARTGKQE